MIIKVYMRVKTIIVPSIKINLCTVQSEMFAECYFLLLLFCVMARTTNINQCEYFFNFLSKLKSIVYTCSKHDYVVKDKNSRIKHHAKNENVCVKIVPHKNMIYSTE